ncbi:MAG TPA: hypothetical protein VH592_18265 [Gemmataceae bacterium]|jgi:hypothetical protein
MPRNRIDDRRTFRPTLESLENREVMNAGLAGAAMYPMLPNLAQGAQVHLPAQETLAVLNQNNPLLQSLTQPGQPFGAPPPQLPTNLQVVDRIFVAWSHNVDQVMQNVQSLQHVANQILNQQITIGAGYIQDGLGIVSVAQPNITANLQSTLTNSGVFAGIGVMPPAPAPLIGGGLGFGALGRLGALGGI